VIISKSVLFKAQLFICTVSVWLLSASPVNSAPDVNQVTAQEPQLRAAVILGVIRFTTWPYQDTKENILNVCTFGEPVAKSALLPISRSQKVANKTLFVRSIQVNLKDVFASCDVIVYGSGANADFSLTLLHAAAHSVLIICDGCESDESVATVRLIQRNNRIAFEIDLGLAKKQGIKFSSSLLELASEVHQ